MDTNNAELLEPVNADLYRRRVQNGELRKLSCAGFPRNSQNEQQLSEDTQKFLNSRYEEEHKPKTSPYTLRNVVWLVAAMAVFYYSDFYPALKYDPRINRTWLNIGLMLIAVNIGIALFLIIWISCVQKINSDEWERRYPAAIPVATGAFIIGAICLTVGLWPVWSILTPLILFVLFMGFVVIVTMLPNF